MMQEIDIMYFIMQLLNHLFKKLGTGIIWFSGIKLNVMAQLYIFGDRFLSHCSPLSIYSAWY